MPLTGGFSPARAFRRSEGKQASRSVLAPPAAAGEASIASARADATRHRRVLQTHSGELGEIPNTINVSLFAFEDRLALFQEGAPALGVVLAVEAGLDGGIEAGCIRCLGMAHQLVDRQFRGADR